MAPMATRLRSTAMRVLSSRTMLGTLRARAGVARRLRGQRATVHYFHQVDDPFSHLAVQKIAALRTAYGLAFAPHLVRPPRAAFRGDDARYLAWAIRDAASVARFHDTDFPPDAEPPAPELVAAANALLAGRLADTDFTEAAIQIGEALWSGRALAETASIDPEPALDSGTRLRDRLGHYFGAMFYFDGEWFWGVDRLHHLERRLQREGFARRDAPLCVPFPGVRCNGIKAHDVTLEYFPSLRSPYTAVGHDRVVDLVERTGVNLLLRPVMPMMMRGVPAPQAKQTYIAIDAAREARFHGVRYGRMVDPFGEPVRRAFALFPAAMRMGRGLAYISSYLAAAWADGIDITTDAGLSRVIERAGLNPQALRREAEGDDWQAVLAENVECMLNAGLWGVPSFRVTGGADPTPFQCWGQDRIWRVEAEIARRAQGDATNSIWQQGEASCTS